MNANDSTHNWPVKNSAYSGFASLPFSTNDSAANIPNQELRQGAAKDHAAQIQESDLADSVHDHSKEDASKAFRIQPRRYRFLRDIPPHDYTVPSGDPVNATMAEIISIFPNWFRNRHFALRFQNNGINSSIHFAILNEYRDHGMSTAFEFEKAKEHISDQYRKTLRKIDHKWTRATHKAPENWNSQSIQINDFVPDAACGPNFSLPKPINVKDLANGLKKLPQGADAGDLTRAIEHAMHNKFINSVGNPLDYMFPQDLQIILDQIGRTVITEAHSDPATVMRYGNMLRKVATMGREQKQNMEPETAARNRPLLTNQQQLGLQPRNLQMSNQGLHQVNQMFRRSGQEAAAIVAAKLIDQQRKEMDTCLNQSEPEPYPSLANNFPDPEVGLNDWECQVQENSRPGNQSAFTAEDLQTLIAAYQYPDHSHLWNDSKEPSSGTKE